MSTYFHLDSLFRDRETWPNPASYEVKPDQVATWFRQARSVRAHPQNPSTSPLEFVSSINLHHLIIPYDASFVGLPVLYVEFRSKKYNDIHLVHSIEGNKADVQYVCVLEKIQNDSAGDPMWIHFRSTMEQVMRFRRGDEIIFKVTTRDGSVLPNVDTLVPIAADPNKQILATFDVIPYIRDGDYDNHMKETVVT
ncbi:hypothetical protein OAG24_00415 [bacterium]|nr:hypothetical protein [bacterium]